MPSQKFPEELREWCTQLLSSIFIRLSHVFVRERIKRKVFFRFFYFLYKYRELNLNVHLNILSYNYNDNKIVQNQLMKSCYTNTLDLTTTIFDKLVSYLTRKRRVRSSCSI